MSSMDFSANPHRYREYVDALEEERRKIHVFRRELPLCFHLVSQAIDVCRKQMCGSSMENVGAAESECSEQTTSDCPLLEQFIPVKGCSSICDEEEEAEEERSSASNIDEKPKLDWLRSVRLWNQNSDPPTTDDEDGKNSPCDRGGCKQWEMEKCTSTAVESSSTGGEEHGNVGLGGRGKGDKGEESVPRKARRCWSPELHRCFLNALQQLGGAHVATPKQIREVMKVEGLTNDEVKSHLQKFRLHARKPSSPSCVDGGNGMGRSRAQFVLMGGMWSSCNETDEPPPVEGICKEEINNFQNTKPFSSILNSPLRKLDHHKPDNESAKAIKCITNSAITSSHLVL